VPRIVEQRDNKKRNRKPAFIYFSFYLDMEKLKNDNESVAFLTVLNPVIPVICVWYKAKDIYM
jgi:hypothetical protein